MATPIADSMTDNSVKDGTNDPINGSEVDTNPNALAQILDGTTQTDLGGAGAVYSRAFITRTLDVAAGSVKTPLSVEWNPSDGSNLTDNSSGLGIPFIMPDDADNQDVYGRLDVMVVSDATGSEEGEFSFKGIDGGSAGTEWMTLSGSGLRTYVGTITSAGNIISDTDSTDDLGTTSVRWANVYTDALGDSGQALTINSTNVTKPNNCYVLVLNSATDSNVTGNNTTATIDLDSEIFDIGGDFASDTFTAPVTGKYRFEATVDVSGVTASCSTLYLQVATSNRTARLMFYDNPTTGRLSLNGSATLDMDASDTATLQVVGNGEGGDVHDIIGSSPTMVTWLSVQLVQ